MLGGRDDCSRVKNDWDCEEEVGRFVSLISLGVVSPSMEDPASGSSRVSDPEAVEVELSPVVGSVSLPSSFWACDTTSPKSFLAVSSAV